MLNTVTPASVLRAVADELLADLDGDVDGTFLTFLIAAYTEPAGVGQHLLADTVLALAWHTGWPTLSSWLPPEQPLPACVVAGIMRTAAAALEVAE